MSTVVRKAITPVEILQNSRGKAVSIELTDGETINGTVMRTDRSMNIVLKQCIRTDATGEHFWKARETLVRGAGIKNVRMCESVLKVTVISKGKGRGAGKAAAKKAKADSHRKM